MKGALFADLENLKINFFAHRKYEQNFDLSQKEKTRGTFFRKLSQQKVLRMALIYPAWFYPCKKFF